MARLSVAIFSDRPIPVVRHLMDSVCYARSIHRSLVKNSAAIESEGHVVEIFFYPPQSLSTSLCGSVIVTWHAAEQALVAVQSVMFTNPGSC